MFTVVLFNTTGGANIGDSNTTLIIARNDDAIFFSGTYFGVLFFTFIIDAVEVKKFFPLVSAKFEFETSNLYIILKYCSSLNCK